MRCSETGTSSVDWAQLSKFYLKTETECNFRNVMFLNKNRTVFEMRTMGNVQKHNICTNVLSSQTFKSYLCNGLFLRGLDRVLALDLNCGRPVFCRLTG
jgi:hypothetical protein